MLSLRSYSLFTLSLFIIIAVLHALGFAYSLYFYLWWYDIMMHLLGGFAVALLVTYILCLRPKDAEGAARKVSVRKIFLTVLVSALVIGVVWEIFEFIINRLFTLRGNDMTDTVADLLNDLLGAAVSVKIFLMFQKSREKAKIPEVEAKILL